ncbi:hypothetical protein PG991_011094 [Apiospora marii]|uniref:Uncharacterized protein n=1 Tax=Apiospora marii TaxID=335849 RepID=A0ABR1RD63_9PEZI
MDNGSNEGGAVAKTVSNIRRLSCDSLRASIILRDRLKRIRYQPPSAPDVLKDLRSLEQILEDTVDLLNKQNDTATEQPRLEMSLKRLETDLQDFLNQMKDWVVDDALQPSCGNQWNDLFKRIRFYHEIAAEKCAQFEQRLQQLEKEVAFVPNEVSDILSSSESPNSSSSHNAGKEDGKSDLSYSSRTSMPRYGSGTNNMKPKSLRDMAQNPIAPQVCHWSCDALNGIDDVFEYHGTDGYSVCRLCSFKFYWTDDDCFIRQGQHLVKRHAFGSCEGPAAFEDRGDFMNHLAVSHKMMVDDFNRGSPKERSSKPWIDGLFRRWGSAPKPSDIPVTRPDDTSQLSYPVFVIRFLDEISRILQASGLMLRSDYYWVPKGELTGHPWNRSACVTEICNALAKLDDDETARTLGWREYSRVCYTIGCLEEELAIMGHEDLLTLESYRSSAHDALWHSVPLQDKKSPVYCATLLDALRVQNHAYDRAETFKQAGARAITRMLECLQTEISRSPAASPMGRLHARAINMPFRLARDPTLGAKEARRAQTLIRKIDEWIMGIFVHSIPLRRVLMSGKAIPELASTMPTSWALRMMEHWAPASSMMQTEHKQEKEDESGGRSSIPGLGSYPDSAYSVATMSSMSSSSGTIRVKRLTLFQASPGKLQKSAAHLVCEVEPDVRPLSSRCSTYFSNDTTAFGEGSPQSRVLTLPPD